MAGYRMSPAIQILHNPDPRTIPADFLEFLQQLGGPTLIRIDGADRSRCRAMATLLHGNEPSGARALHRWLREGRQPLTDQICLVAAVRTALHEEPFRHRFMPGERDLNRCFRAPFDDAPGRIAGEFLRLLQHYRPECLVDIHNTSGMSPAFGVAAHENEAHEALVSRFCERLVITDLNLGALMEISGTPCPAVTVECGGARDPQSDLLARAGLERYFLDEDVLAARDRHARMDLYHHPVRLELRPGTRIAWADAPVPEADLTVLASLEQLNFGTALPGTAIGWLGANAADCLSVRNGRGDDVAMTYFSVREGILCAAQPLKLFMVTSNPVIALSDCLLYAAAEREHTIIEL
jgi:hypothetical protein